MDVGIAPSEPASRFFRREFEKTLSPEKEELHQDDESFADVLLGFLEKDDESFADVLLGFLEKDDESFADELLGFLEKEEQDPSRVELVLDLTYLGLADKEEEAYADEVEEIEKRTAGATVGLPQFRTDEDGKLMELVSQKYIRALMKSPPPSKPLSDYSIEALKRTGITDEVELETVARGFRAMQSARDTQNDIIQQYRAQGYAYVALP